MLDLVSGLGKPVSVRDLARQLSLDSAGRRELTPVLRQLISDGVLVKIRGAHVGLPDRMNLVVGRLSCNPGGFGFVFYGEQDRLVVHRDGTRIPAAEKARKFKVPAGGVEVYRMAKHADYNMNHKEDWFAAIRSGLKPCMDIQTGHRVATMCNLGNLSYLLGRKLTWDGVKQEVAADAGANRLLSRPQRHPYML